MVKSNHCFVEVEGSWRMVHVIQLVEGERRIVRVLQLALSYESKEGLVNGWYACHKKVRG